MTREEVLSAMPKKTGMTWELVRRDWKNSTVEDIARKLFTNRAAVAAGINRIRRVYGYEVEFKKPVAPAEEKETRAWPKGKCMSCRWHVKQENYCDFNYMMAVKRVESDAIPGRKYLKHGPIDPVKGGCDRYEAQVGKRRGKAPQDEWLERVQ